MEIPPKVQPSSPIQKLLFKYLRAQHVGMPSAQDGSSLVADTDYLLETLQDNSHVNIKKGISYVALSLAVIAWNNNTTIEECLNLAIQAEKDKKPVE